MNTNTRVNRIGCTAQADGSIDVVIPVGAAEEFKQMVRRATHTWQDQSDEMRDFADRILGRAAAMGANMKPEIFGYPVSAVVAVQPETLGTNPGLAKRSCCGTLLREPHHSQCKEVTGKYLNSHPAGTGVLDDTLALQNIVKAKCFCDGHPETCNCSFHCR